MYQYCFHLLTPVNAHHFNIFRNFLMVVLSIPVSFALTCYDRPIISSLCISDWFWEALPVFPRNSQNRCRSFIFRKKRKWGRTFLLSRKYHIAIIEVCHMTGLLVRFTCKSQSMDRQINKLLKRERWWWRKEQTRVHADAKTSTWNYFQGLQCFLFNVLNSS